MKSLFWLSQAALLCSILYYSPLLSPVISYNWNMEEWSVRYGQYRNCISRNRPEGSTPKNLRWSCNQEAYGLLSFELPEGKHEEIIDYNIATFGTNSRPLIWLPSIQTMSGRCSEKQAWSMGWRRSCSAVGLEQALAVFLGDPCHCRSSSRPDTSEADLKEVGL